MGEVPRFRVPGLGCRVKGSGSSVLDFMRIFISEHGGLHIHIPTSTLS